jgi:hypothetical protein
LVVDGNQKESDTCLAPYLTTFKDIKRLGMTVLVRTDHGLRNWYSCVKLFTASPSERHRCHEQSRQKKYQDTSQSGFRVLQTAPVTCKKDHPIILTPTVMEALDAGYDKLKGVQLVILYCSESVATEGLYTGCN